MIHCWKRWTYNGALILVTHNEMYLRALVNKLIVFDRNRVFVFNGSYQRFLEEIGWEADQEGDTAKTGQPMANAQTNYRKALRQERAEIINRRSQVLRPLEARINYGLGYWRRRRHLQAGQRQC